MQYTPVLIVGGSLVGLSASLFLAWRGVPHILVEQHAGSSPHPRVMGFTETTIEHYRAVGIAGRIRQAPPGARLRWVKVASLSPDWIAETDWTPGQSADRTPDLSPCTGAAIAQDRLEPILREAALEMGAKHRYCVELVTFDHGIERVTARLSDRTSGVECVIMADYLIAADVAASSIRETMDVPHRDVGYLKTLRSVLFSCPQADRYLKRGARQFEIEQEDFCGFLTTYGDSCWLLMFDDDKERSPEALPEAVLRALGAEMPFSILATGQWDVAGRLADRYSDGRVFLAGDAAHQLPRTRGGFGANTGIDDVWNLAWKLARVLSGSAPSALLDTYHEERHPIGWLRHQQTFSRPDYARWVGSGFKPDALFCSDAMEFGQIVRASAVTGVGPELPAAATPAEWGGQPGVRAPHAWVMQGTTRISTLDLFGQDFVLLAADGAWREGVNTLALKVVLAGSDIVFSSEACFGKLFGVGAKGAILVRPDGIVAWRSKSAFDEAGLDDVRRLIAACPRMPER